MGGACAGPCDDERVESFWEFLGNYWWLAFIFGGSIAAAGRQVLKTTDKMSKRRLERYRIRQAYKHGHEAAIGDRATERQAFVSATERLMTDHTAVDDRWLAYELDPVKLLEYPLMTDMREAVTVDFHRAKRLADSLRPAAPSDITDRETQREYREAVHAYASAFEVAEAEARRVRQGGFSTDERARIATAMKLLRLALDDAASPDERQSAYQRVRREIDGLIVLPAATDEVVTGRIAGQLPRSAPTDGSAPQP